MKWTSYKLLPTVDEIYALRQGSLGKNRTQELMALSQSNPLLASAINAVTSVQQVDAKVLSSRLKQKMQPILKTRPAYWNNYLLWGVFLCALLLLFCFFYPNKNIEKQTTIANEIHNTPTVAIVTNEAPKATKKTESALTVSKKEEKSLLNKNENRLKDAPKLDEKTVLVQEVKPEDDTKKSSTVVLPKATAKVAAKNTPMTHVEKNTNVILNLQYVQILQKINPDDTKIRKTASTQFDPLKRGEVKKNTKTYASDDLPTFPGGDEAIEDYFRGIIRPTSVAASSVSSKNRSCYVRILVNAHGKVKETEIMGNPPQAITEPLEKGLKNLPDFIPGKGNSVEYMLSLSY